MKATAPAKVASRGQIANLKGKIGNRKGVPNKTTTDLRLMILGALSEVGGVDYLAARAADPKTAPAFLALLGKVLPMQVTGEGGGAVALRVEFVKATGASDPAP